MELVEKDLNRATKEEEEALIEKDENGLDRHTGMQKPKSDAASSCIDPAINSLDHIL